MRSRAITLLVLGAVALTLGLTACAPALRAPNAPATAVAPVTDQYGKEMLAAAINARAAVETLVAKGDMRIQDRANKFSLGVQIDQMAAVYPDRLRLKTSKLAGTVEAFDILMRDNNIAFFVPRHHTLYVGTVGQLKQAQGGLNFSPEIMLDRLLHGSRPLLNYEWRTGSRDNKSLTLEQVHRPDSNYLRVTLDPRQKVILRVAYLNPAGGEYFVEEYDNYRALNGGLFPTRFALLWGDERFVRFNLKDVELGRSAAALGEAFAGIDNLDMERVKRQPLQDARVDGDEQ
ncbi:hypothetical protein FACS1894139_13100 [Planctomycetales bacterium]|nr:hypothetical protein FACS1894107_05130 [Planctomycetales bacterium]GHS99879.1 hypothetical protein FACS1894108_10720 [Planctomycetales bacterium]GHT06681.1 hypothetical protein FACS1894139_13100 [Planctomycetales bacterium]